MQNRNLTHIHLIEIFLIFSIAFILIVTAGTYIYFANTLVSKEKIMNNNDTGMVLYDREDKPFFTFYEGKNKEFVSLSKISPHLKNAVVAVEDKEFYNHSGFSVKGILRSVVKDIQERNLAFGGSTITQQLVKNALLTSQKSFIRKYQEIVLAREIERRYSKDEILEMYLNSVYFGEGAFGAQEAAKAYFGKDAADLTLSEASFLAGILPAPSAYSPFNGGAKAAQMRQEITLSDMKQLGFITQKEYDEAKNQKLTFNRVESDINNTAPHFAIMVKDFLVQEYGEEEIVRGGLKVKTTLDRDIQEYAEDSVRRNVDRLEGNRAGNAAAVVMDISNREVLALVGSKDWFNTSFGKVNMATSPRQPGSSFKPIVYATAFEDGAITNATQLHDVPTTFRENGPGTPEYKPKDYDGRYRGIVMPRRALANSLNIPAVEVMSKLSVPEVLDKSKTLGITTLKDPSNYGLSLVLGTAEVPLLEMTNVYATLGDQGKAKTPVTVTEVTDKNARTLFKSETKETQVFSPEVAYIVTNILSDNRARQEMFGGSLTVNLPAAVKTGTTENYRDAWTIGYTPFIAVGVWVGNNDGTLMDNVAGSLGAAPIWKDLITYASREKPAVAFTKPENVITYSTCMYFGSKSETASSSAVTEYFVAGTEPSSRCRDTASSTVPSAEVSPGVTNPPSEEATPTPVEEDNRGKDDEIKEKVKREIRIFTQ